MTGAVQIVHSLAPHRHARRRVELRARRSVGKLHVLQLQVSFKHERIHTPLFVCHRTERHRARYVRSAVDILRPAVYQYHTFRPQRGVTLSVSLIMHYGAVFLITGNGVEREVSVHRVGSPQPAQTLAHAHLRLPATLHGRLQPHKEPHQCHTVAHHRASEPLYLGGVLHSLHRRHR